MPIFSTVKMLRILTIGLLLASPARANFCDECIVTTNPVPSDWEEREKASTLKPDNLSPEEIAKVMVLSSRMPTVPNAAVDERISKWETPLRVRIVGVDGNDLPLDQSPGDVIAGFLQRLSRDTDIPISITTLEKKDNNVSIVAGVLPRNTNKEVPNVDNMKIVAESQAPFNVADDFASIQGVASMNVASRTLAGAWLGKSDEQGKWFSDISFDGGLGHAFLTFPGVYRVGAEIKGCMLTLNSSKAAEKNMAEIVRRMDEYMASCLGMNVYGVWRFYSGDSKQQKERMNFAAGRQGRYFLKLLYQTSKAGMNAGAGEKAVLEHINHK